MQSVRTSIQWYALGLLVYSLESISLVYLIGVEAFHNAQHGAGSGAIFFDLLSCDGTETSISQCSVRYLHSCSHSDDASVQCIGEALDIPTSIIANVFPLYRCRCR